MTILDKIVAHKRTEVLEQKELFPVKRLEQSIYFETQPVSFRSYLEREDKVGIVAEIKRKSPSKGLIHPYVNVEQLSIGYMQAGASAISVLTDKEFFGGSNNDLTTARTFNFCPILRKDFIVDEYQVVEARSIGADVILLIAAVLSPEEIQNLAKTAHSLGLEVLLEVHNEEELANSPLDHVDVLGVNNRNLHDFSVSLETSEALAAKIPEGVTKISESGIRTAKDIVRLRKVGYKGFLIGEQFMSHSRPDEACARLVHDVKALLS